MNNLSLDFDNDVKNITMDKNNSNDNLSFTSRDSRLSDDKSEKQLLSPKLNVSDPMGIEFLAKKSVSVNSKKEDLSPKPPAEKTDDSFSFFKPSEPENIPKETHNEEDDMIINQKKQETIPEFKPIHRLSPQDIKNEKIDLLYKFKKLDSQGIRTTMNYNMNSHLEDMRNEYIKLKNQREIENSIKFQRKMMMACVTGLEFMNNKFDPFSIELDGWSESVNENLNDYDEIFEELHEKYGGASDMAPELRLLFTLAGSAFMFHLSNTMFKSSIPGMDDVLKQNPELMKQFAEAAVGSINKNPPPPNPLSAMMGINPLGSMMGGGQQKPQGNTRPVSPSRSDMSGPDPNGIDDLINKMNLQPDKIPDLDNISLASGGTDRKSSGGGITLNL